MFEISPNVVTGPVTGCTLCGATCTFRNAVAPGAMYVDALWPPLCVFLKMHRIDSGPPPEFGSIFPISPLAVLTLAHRLAPGGCPTSEACVIKISHKFAGIVNLKAVTPVVEQPSIHCALPLLAIGS